MSVYLAYRRASLAAAGLLASASGTATAQAHCSDILVSGLHCSIDAGIADYASPASRAAPLAPGTQPLLELTAAIHIAPDGDQQAPLPQPGEQAAPH